MIELVRTDISNLAIEYAAQRHDSKISIDLVSFDSVGVVRVRVLAPKGFGLVDGWLDGYRFCRLGLSQWAASVNAKKVNEIKAMMRLNGVDKSGSYYRNFSLHPITFGAMEAMELYCPSSFEEELLGLINEVYRVFSDSFVSAQVSEYWKKGYADLSGLDAKWLSALATTNVKNIHANYDCALQSCLDIFLNFHSPNIGLLSTLKGSMDISVREIDYSGGGYLDESLFKESLFEKIKLVKCLRLLLLERAKIPYFYTSLKFVFDQCLSSDALMAAAKGFKCIHPISGEEVKYLDVLRRYIDFVENQYPIYSRSLDLPRGLLG